MARVKDITLILEEFAPLSLQESYDNSGLIIGNPEMEVDGVLLVTDCIQEVLDEAIEKGANLIITHHPLIFNGLKSITGKNSVEKIIIQAIKNNIAIYASHTNIDSVIGGVNSKIADLIGLENQEILSPIKGNLKKLITFIPKDHLDNVRQQIFSTGAGHIGNYDSCGFIVSGEGTFRATENANPYVGEINKHHKENEIRFETVFPDYLEHQVLKALLKYHPYEEVAYDIYKLENENSQIGMGIIGNLKGSIDEITFLNKLKQVFNVAVIRHTKLLDKPVLKVAVCGGSGSFLLKNAMAKGADIFVSGDFKYHQFFDAENRILVADLGHYETEQFTKEIFYSLITKKLPKLAVHLSEINSNPINYL